MSATVAKPETGNRLSRAELRRRWDELTDDPLVAAIPYKIELNEKGVIEVSPPTTQHASLQAKERPISPPARKKSGSSVKMALLKSTRAQA